MLNPLLMSNQPHSAHQESFDGFPEHDGGMQEEFEWPSSIKQDRSQ
jgi:hypothetical protein